MQPQRWNEAGATDADETRPGPGLHLLLVRGVRRSWAWVCALVVLGVATGVVAGLVSPNRFASNAKLLLRVGTREQITSESLVGMEADRRVALPTMVDELQMLADVAIFERVARAVGPREILQPADAGRDDGPSTSAPIRLLHRLQSTVSGWWASPHDCGPEECATCLRLATKALHEDATVVNEPGSNVILLGYASTTPERAQTIVHALAAAFIERHRSQFSIQAMVEANRSRVDETRKTRDEALDAYVTYMNQNVVDDVESQVPSLQLEITALEGELFTARVRRKSILRQRDSLSGRLKAGSPELAVAGPTVMVPNEEYETQLILKRSLLAQKQSLPFESRTIEETRRRERVIDAQLAEVDRKLQTLPVAVAQSSQLLGTLGQSPLSTRVEDLDLEDQGLAVKIEAQQERLGDAQARYQEVRKQMLLATLRREDLEATRDAAEGSYKQLLARFSVLEALGQIELSEDPNLRVLQAPTLDPEKVGPKRLSLLLRGLLAGLLAGVAFAMVRQWLDRTLSHPDAFEHASDVPVLGVVPRVPSWDRPAPRPAADRN